MYALLLCEPPYAAARDRQWRLNVTVQKRQRREGVSTRPLQLVSRNFVCAYEMKSQANVRRSTVLFESASGSSLAAPTPLHLPSSSTSVHALPRPYRKILT